MDFTALNLTPLGLGVYNVKDQAAREALTGKIAYAEYNSQSKTILFYNTADSPTSDNILCYIDARGFIKDGMVDSVVVEDGNLVITFNTESGKEPISIPLTDIFNPDLYYTKSEIDAAMQKKANTDGWYPRMVVGAAESVIGKDIDVDEATDYVVQGGTGIAKVNEVMGRSEKWNQLVKISDILATKTVKGITLTNNGDGTITCNGTTTENWWANYTIGTNIAALAKIDDKCLIKGAYSRDIYLRPASVASGDDYGQGGIFTVIQGVTYIALNFRGSENNPITAENVVIKPQVFNLTEIYGAGNEPTTVEQFEADVFAKYGKTLDEYFAYDAGSINNANVEKLDITGLNQWDEQWELGTFHIDTGNPIVNNTRIRSKNYVSVIPSAEYYFAAPARVVCSLFYYDTDKNYLHLHPNVDAGRTFVVPANCAFIRFYFSTDYGTTYKNDICINISDATKNGTYEPYRHVELPINIKTITGKVNGEGESVTIFPNGMRGVGTAYDSLIVDEDGWARRAIVRMASVDLGSLNWTKASNSTRFASSGLAAVGGSNNNVLCSKYSTQSAPSIYNGTAVGIFAGKSGYFGANTYMLEVFDSAYSDAASFKAAMDGVELIYELATPIEYVLDTPILMTFNAYNGGVIRQIKGDMELATRINITFALNVQGFINNANKDFVSAASMQAFLTKLSSAKGGTWGMTYNTTTQQYEFTYNR